MLQSSLVLLIAVLGHFCVDLMIGVWPVFKTIAEMDLAVAGLITAFCAFVGEGLQIFFGHLSDRGHSKSLMMGGLCAAAGCAFLAYTHHYGAFLVLYLLTCLGSGAFHPAAVGLVGNLSQGRKGLLITFFAAGGTLGMAFSQILFTTSYYRLDGHTSVLAIPIALLIVLIAFSHLPRPTSSQKHSLKDTLSLLNRRELKLLYVSQVCNQTVLWSFLFFLPDILTAREFDSWISLGGGHMIAILGGACMLVPAGYLADRFSCKVVILASSAIGALLLYTFLFASLLSNASLLILLFFLGAALSIVNPVTVAFGNQIAPQHPGKVSALLMGLVWCVSEGLGQGGGGLMTKLFTENAPERVLSVLGVFLIVGMAVASRLPRIVETQPEPVSIYE